MGPLFDPINVLVKGAHNRPKSRNPGFLTDRVAKALMTPDSRKAPNSKYNHDRVSFNSAKLIKNQGS